RACWEHELGAGQIASDMLETLAGRFSLTDRQIASAAATARGRARWRALMAADDPRSSMADPTPLRSELFAAAREQTGHELAALARKLDPRHDWQDLILPDDDVAQLRE